MTLESVENLFCRRRAEITAEMCKKCVEHVEHVELSYWKTNKISKWINLKYHWMQMKKKVTLNSTVIKRIFNFLMCKCELMIVEVYFQTQLLPVLSKFDFFRFMVVRN